MHAKTHALALAALALALGSGAARADIRSSAVVSGFGYSLIDLRPDDGIDPGITLLTAPRFHGGTLGAARAFQVDRDLSAAGFALRSEDRTQDSLNMFVPLSATAGLPGVSSSAAIGGSLAGHGASLSAQGQLLNDGARAGRREGTFFDAVALAALVVGGNGGTNNFLLAPYTQVVWSGHASLRAESTVAPSQATRELAYASVYFTLEDAALSTVGSFIHDLVTPANGAPTRQSFDSAFSLSLSNASGAAVMGYLQAGITAGGKLEATPLSLPPPVPEPGTVALLLCGLGVVAGAARLRGGWNGAAAA